MTLTSADIASTRTLPPTGEVEAWLVSLGVSPHDGVLSQEERDRAARFRFERDRRRFVARRAARRRILASYLGVDPAALVFNAGPAGKPGVHGLEFSASHSEDLAIIVVAREPIGVDLEHASHAELAGSLHLLSRWCCREAALKLGGEGLSVEPTTVQIREEAATYGSQICRVKTYIPRDGYLAAVAAARPVSVTWMAF